MAALDEVHVGDIGTVFEATITDAGVVVDISGASTKDLNFLKPDGTTTLNKNGSFTTDGTDGKLRYTTISGDLDTAGTWQIQAHVILGGGAWKSDIIEFNVFANII